ncbi:MAG: PEP-CTERM sorting domain-containing protein [Burkholderiales bacterium]|nr:PEP-CTERM sorting domain-containing protein [Burkholderiales bacterium]
MRTAFLIGLVIAVQALPAPAAPVLNPGNGNHYELVLVPDPFTGSNNSWATASAAAAASDHLGVNGHLATITSAAENQFLFALVSPQPGSTSPFAGAWLGGDAAQWLEGPETAQALGYLNWGGAEPNNGGLMYMNIGGLFAGIGSGQWADDSGVQGFPAAGTDPVIGFFVEYETGAAAPAPATLALIGIGLLGGLYRGRREPRRGRAVLRMRRPT